MLLVSPPTGVTAVQHGLSSIIVTWTASSDATGYRISYTSSGGDSGSADVSGDSHTLTGLVRETTYTISITATSQSLSSSSVTVEVTLSEAVSSIMSSFLIIRALVDAQCRDGAVQISRERVQRGHLTRQGTRS